MKILVTGSAGFIGFHLVNKLVEEGHEIIGLDNLNNYYSIDLKYDRLKECGIEKASIQYNCFVQSTLYSNYCFICLNLEDKENIYSLFAGNSFDIVVNLAAQAGVRYSLENPFAYVDSNINGFLTILEACRQYPVQHLVYASSSSVYGLNEKIPFSEKDPADHPVSLYAATKRSNELMAHSYSSLYNIPVTGLRFFTVYGPWGRPDMAPFLFIESILNNKPLRVFNNGNMMRDFTYIDDIVEGVIRVMKHQPLPDVSFDSLNSDPSASSVPYRIYNIGNSSPVKLMDFIYCFETVLGKKAKIEYLPMQPGDVTATYADTTAIADAVGYSPSVGYEKGVSLFVHWYRDYFAQKK